MWSCWRLRNPLAAEVEPAQVTLQAISSIRADSLAPTAGLVTLTLGHGVGKPDRDELLSAIAAGKSVDLDAAEELPVFLGNLHDVLVDAQVCGLTSAPLDHDAGDHVMTRCSNAAWLHGLPDEEDEAPSGVRGRIGCRKGGRTNTSTKVQ